MKRLLLFLLPCLLAAPAFAGTLYVPFSANFELGGTSYQTWIWVTNHDSEPVTVELVEADTVTGGMVFTILEGGKEGKPAKGNPAGRGRPKPRGRATGRPSRKRR